MLQFDLCLLFWLVVALAGNKPTGQMPDSFRCFERLPSKGSLQEISYTTQLSSLLVIDYG